MVIAHNKGRWIEELGIKEKDFHVIECDENYLLLRIPDSTLFEIDEQARDRVLAELKPLKRNTDLLNKYDLEELREVERELKRILPRKKKRADTVRSLPRIDTISLNVSARCNLRCSYCYAGYGAYGEKEGLMDKGTAFEAIRFFTSKLKAKDAFHIQFFGGEPLMNFELIKEVVSYTKDIKRKRGISFSYSVSTNGTLFEKRIVRFLRGNRFRVSVSIDGLAEIHDRNRTYPDGRGSFAEVKKGIELLCSNGIKDPCARVTVADTGLDFVRTYRVLREMGFSSVHFTPRTYPGGNGSDESNWKQMKSGMKALYEYCSGSKGRDELRRIGNFAYIIDRIERRRQVKNPCRAGRTYMGVDLKGRFSLCHRFTGNRRFYMGSIKDGLRSIPLPASVEVHSLCGQCWARFICGAGCYYENYCKSGDPGIQGDDFCDYTKALISWAIMLYIRRRENGTEKRAAKFQKPYL